MKQNIERLYYQIAKDFLSETEGMKHHRMRRHCEEFVKLFPEWPSYLLGSSLIHDWEKKNLRAE